MQWNEDGTERPISFVSSKLTGSQLSWAAIEKETYPVVWALKKFRNFGVPIVIYSNSNPPTSPQTPLKVQNLLVSHLLCKNIIIHSNIGEGLLLLSLIFCHDHAVRWNNWVGLNAWAECVHMCRWKCRLCLLIILFYCLLDAFRLETSLLNIVRQLIWRADVFNRLIRCQLVLVHYPQQSYYSSTEGNYETDVSPLVHSNDFDLLVYAASASFFCSAGVCSRNAAI